MIWVIELLKSWPPKDSENFRNKLQNRFGNIHLRQDTIAGVDFQDFLSSNNEDKPSLQKMREILTGREAQILRELSDPEIKLQPQVDEAHRLEVKNIQIMLPLIEGSLFRRDETA